VILSLINLIKVVIRRRA